MIQLKKRADTEIPNANTWKVIFFADDDGAPKYKDEAWDVFDFVWPQWIPGDPTGLINDATTVTDKTWSSSKINTEIPRQIKFDPSRFSVAWSLTAQNITLTAWQSVNLLNNFTTAWEVVRANVAPVYKNIYNVTQTYFLDETNNRFIFPSNLYTYGNTYSPYVFRITGTFNIPTTSWVTTRFLVQLRRYTDNSIIYTIPFIMSDVPGAQTGVVFSGAIPSFVNSETDPFVVSPEITTIGTGWGGCYIEILNTANSSTSITLQDIGIRIFKE